MTICAKAEEHLTSQVFFLLDCAREKNFFRKVVFPPVSRVITLKKAFFLGPLVKKDISMI